MPIRTPPVSSGSGGNATVPSDYPIQPAQAFVDNILAFCNFIESLNLVSKGITYINSSFLLSWISSYNNLSGTATLDFSDNNLSQISVDDMLAAFVANMPSVNYLDISGGTNAIPTIVPSIHELATVTISIAPVDGDIIRIRNQATGINFNNSSYDDATSVYVNGRTFSQIKNEIQGRFQNFGITCGLTGNVFTLDDGFPAILLSDSYYIGSTIGTFNETQHGVKGIDNVQDLQNNGWEVYTN